MVCCSVAEPPRAAVVALHRQDAALMDMLFSFVLWSFVGPVVCPAGLA